MESHLLEKTILAAPLFFICAYKSYKAFRHADSKIKLGKFVLGLTLLTLVLVALYSLTITGLNGYAFLVFILTAYLLAPGLILGLLVGSSVGISIRGWKSGRQSQKIMVTVCWIFVLIAEVVHITLWQQQKTYQQKNRIKTELALDFVKHHSAVTERVGADAVPRLTSMIFPKDAVPNNGRPLPIGYVISIDDERLYAVVSTPQEADDHKFTLDCITPLSHDERYGNRDRCKK